MENLSDIQKLYWVEMRKSKSISFFDIAQDELYKRELFTVLSKGIETRHQMEFLELLDYVIVKKSQLFNVDGLLGELYEGEDNISDLILPSIRRVFNKIYVQPPPLFLDNPLRLELYQLSFDIDEFIDYFIKMIKISKSCLDIFEYLDRTSQTLELIVDNYIAKIVKSVLDASDINKDIEKFQRDKKIKKLIND
jgi:hypothetical protein